MGQAMILELEGRTAEAYRAYGDLALKAPDDAWIKLKYESIRSSSTQGHLLEAERVKATDKAKYIRELEQAAFFSPDLAAITLQIADHYFDQGDWQRSLPYYEAVLEKEPHNEAVLLKLAALYEKKENFDLAMVTLDRLLALKPGDPFLESEKKRVRDRFQELTLPEKFKKIFFKTEINREELAALVGFYFDRYIEMDGCPRDHHRHRRLVRQGADHQDRDRRHHARPARPYLRPLRHPRPLPFRRDPAGADRLPAAKRAYPALHPPGRGAGHRRSLAAAQGIPGHLRAGQLPGAGPRRPGQFQPHQPRRPGRRHYALKKILNAIENQ